MAEIPAAPFGECGGAAACTALLCRGKRVLPYRGLLLLNCSQLPQAGGERPHFHQGTPGSCGSAGTRAGSPQGRGAVSSSCAKPRSHGAPFPLCMHCTVLMQSHQRGAGRAARRTLAPHAEPHMAPYVAVWSHATGRGLEVLPTSAFTQCWGPGTWCQLLLEMRNSPSLCLILALHLEALHCWFPW